MQWQQWQQCVNSRERTEGENWLSVCLGDVERDIGIWDSDRQIRLKYPDTKSHMSISGLVID